MTWWLALPALAGFQALVLPREHPPGGLDNQELRVADSRVCLWYSTELGPLYRSGRTVFVQKGYERRRLGNCSDSYYGPVQSISLHRDLLSFSLTNSDRSKSWHAYLLDIDPRGKREIIFPSRYESAAVAKLERAEVRPLPQMYLSLSVPGVETIKVLVSSKAVQEIALLEGDGYVSRAELNPFERLLLETETRNAPVAVPSRQWASAQMDIVVLK